MMDKVTRVTNMKDGLTFWCVVSTVTYDIIEYGWGIRDGTKRYHQIRKDHPAQGYIFCTAWEG